MFRYFFGYGYKKPLKSFDFQRLLIFRMVEKVAFFNHCTFTLSSELNIADGVKIVHSYTAAGMYLKMKDDVAVGKNNRMILADKEGFDEYQASMLLLKFLMVKIAGTIGMKWHYLINMNHIAI
ncbi:MAG: hypothetical protein P0Y62_19025 [Candidatus Chryseobacterium colombiense]|nr:hypothetical protein [Chryseobacterium sp.]WEK69887.1 MAG: hypothetical protein P0Y62_19025 [Chryseobacterium sp.]